ncbi:histidine--tRNA ligase [bacterium]|nr:histidine--tRNA ligase [bacterium]
MRDNYLFHGVKGMRDVFPEESWKIRQLEEKARALFACYGFGEIRTPLVEHTILFERGVGQGTDIVNKEMFYVPAKEQDGEDDKRNRQMVLRPEATASVVRAYVEHEIAKVSPGCQRYYYIGSMFRYERPQRGRYRQFAQIGIEVLGATQPSMDAEVILLLHDLLAQYGLTSLTFQLNAVGCLICRPPYIRKLQEFARTLQTKLCPDCQIRIEKNPLRLFDCKQPECRKLISQAPVLPDFLCSDCRSHQKAVFQVLEKNNIRFEVEPRLMRGLDYYTRTVFEVISKDLGAQNAVAAGGRYDNLVADLDGPQTPAIGWSLGVERLMELLLDTVWEPTGLDALVVAPGPEFETTFVHVTDMRRQGLRIGMEHEARSVKALLKRADRLHARFALFVSAADPEKLEVKNMQSGEQVALTWDQLKTHISTFSQQKCIGAAKQ